MAADRWKRHNFNNFESWQTIPSSPGCYVVYGDGQVIYVGESTDLRRRIVSNHEIRFARYTNFIESPWGKFTDLYVKVRESVRYGDWAMIELRLIKRLQPPHNCKGSTRPRRIPQKQSVGVHG